MATWRWIGISREIAFGIFAGCLKIGRVRTTHRIFQQNEIFAMNWCVVRTLTSTLQYLIFKERNIMMRVFLSIPLFLLTACSFTPTIVQKNEHYNENTQARIRIYSGNFTSAFTKDIDCKNNQNGKRIVAKTNLDPVILLSAGLLTGDNTSQSIGMPTTVNNSLEGLKNITGRYALFREFVIPAGSPINIETHISNFQSTPGFGSRTDLCSATGSFVPQAGHDYEFLAGKNRQCGIRLYEISKQGALTPIEVNRPISCKR